MSRTRVKICGVTRSEDAALAAALGADAIGLVFWPRSPRCVSPEQAAAIVSRLPPFVTAVGVFVDERLDEIGRIADLVGLGAVQLHGDEPASTWSRASRPVLKAVGVDALFDANSLADWPASVMPLLDVKDAARRGGTGCVVDWTVAARAARVRPIVLAGGLRPTTVGAAIRDVAPFAVDVSSGVEHEPGVKDPERLRAFFAAVARADGSGTP